MSGMDPFDLPEQAHRHLFSGQHSEKERRRLIAKADDRLQQVANPRPWERDEEELKAMGMPPDPYAIPAIPRRKK